jgi:hypothetical protein
MASSGRSSSRSSWRKATTWAAGSVMSDTRSFSTAACSTSSRSSWSTCATTLASATLLGVRLWVVPHRGSEHGAYRPRLSRLEPASGGQRVGLVQVEHRDQLASGSAPTVFIPFEQMVSENPRALLCERQDCVAAARLAHRLRLHSPERGGPVPISSWPSGRDSRSACASTALAFGLNGSLAVRATP